MGSPGDTSAYSATKGAVRLFTKSTAVQHAKDHIRCNSVHPGPIDTAMVRGPDTPASQLEAMAQRVPLGRLGTSEEIAYGVLYLASDEAGWITGETIQATGGSRITVGYLTYMHRIGEQLKADATEA